MPTGRVGRVISSSRPPYFQVGALATDSARLQPALARTVRSTTEGTAATRLSIGWAVARAEMAGRSAERRRVDMKIGDHERAAGRRAGDGVGDAARVPAERLTPKLIHTATDAPAATARATTRGQQRIEML